MGSATSKRLKNTDLHQRKMQDYYEIVFRVNRNSTIFSATSLSQISREEIPIRYEKKFENFLWIIFKCLTKKFRRKKKRRKTLTIRTLNLGCEFLLLILMFFERINQSKAILYCEYIKIKKWPTVFIRLFFENNERVRSKICAPIGG